MAGSNRGIIGVVSALALTAAALAGSSGIDPANKFSWGENIGWMNWADDDGGSGVTLASNHMTGLVWCENVGHLNVGNGGGPYANTLGTNFGVNIDTDGTLSGYAWGENIGWVNFATPTLGPDRARFDSVSGRLRGYAWGENVGWINLDDATHFVGVVPACPGDANGDGTVDVDDLNIILSQWTTMIAPGTGGDLTGDGVVDVDDLNEVLSNWNQSCP